MTSWNARVEWTRHSGGYNAAELDELMSDLADLHPAISLEHDPGEHHSQTWSAIVTLEAATLRQATSAALQAVESAIDGKATGVEVLTTHEFDRRLVEPTIPDLVGYAEIADLAGVSRQRARQLADNAGFPPAVIETQAGPLRVRSQVEAWLARWERRPGRPRAGTATS